MFCGFDVFASKAASIIVMASLFVVLVVASGFFSRLIVVGTLGLCVRALSLFLSRSRMAHVDYQIFSGRPLVR